MGAAYQVGEALDELNQAIATLKPFPDQEPGPTKKALTDCIEAFDAAGRSIEEFGSSPDLADVRKDRTAQEAHWKSGIDKLNGAIQQILDAQGTLDDLLESGPPPKETAAIRAANETGDAATEALAEAVRQLGGKPVDLPTDTPSPPVSGSSGHV
jgi:hypothetical protein